MNNIYVQFYEKIPLHSEEEVKWVGWHLGILDEVGDSMPPEEHPEYDEYCRQIDIYQIANDLDGYDFSWDITWSNKEQRSLEIYSLESGDPEKASKFIQQYLIKFHPDKCMSLEWSTFSDRPGPECSMGGSAFITTEKIEYMSTEEWVLAKTKEFNDATKRR